MHKQYTLLKHLCCTGGN